MRSVSLVFVGLILASCGEKAEQPPTNQPLVTEKSTATSTNAAQANVSGNVSGAAPGNSTVEANASAPAPGVLPPANASMRYVGTWAKNKGECASKPWHFTARELTVSGGPHCSFYNVAKVPGGYDVAAQCPTKQPIHTDLIKLRFAESAQAMLVESNAIDPTGLIYCGK